jgi:hypothetical protein
MGMPRRRVAGWAAAALLLLLAAGCATRAGGAASSPSSSPIPSRPTPAASDRLVLQVRHVGGFLPPGVAAASLPVVSIYGDGRVITQGPVPAIYPGFALPNVQVRRISTADVGRLVDRALAAGVRETTDLGRPGVMDAATTRITVATDSGTYVRDAYALAEARGDTRTGGGIGRPTGVAVNVLSPEQQAARAKLLDLVNALTDLEGTLGAGAVGPSAPYAPVAVAAVVRPWASVSRPQDPPQPERPWPGPALPGEPLAAGVGVTCVSASGGAATAVLTAARQANALTPWASADGRTWSVAFRPLLPHESGCADLAG